MEEIHTVDEDIKLQRVAADFISDLENTLPVVLFGLPGSQFPADGVTHHAGRPQSFISKSTTQSLCLLVDRFQEWPQLLDPHLVNLLLPLVSAFCSYMTDSADQYQTRPPSVSSNCFPLPRAVCKILYTFCKVRGEKVISRFFSNEPRYLELMVTVFDQWDQEQKAGVTEDDAEVEPMLWEEKYIMLLWLSHLTLVPFPLESMSSGELGKLRGSLPDEVPSGLPCLAQRLISLSILHFHSSGKDQEAAKTLLVRLCMRQDMQAAGVLSWLVKWSLAVLARPADDVLLAPVTFSFATLSYIAGVTSSASRDVIAPFTVDIFNHVCKACVLDSSFASQIRTSAIARKCTVKVFRSIALHLLQNGLPDLDPGRSQSTEILLEDIIDYLMTSLADKDAPVRFAASKALSIVSFKMDPIMAGDIIGAIIGLLHEDLQWENDTDHQFSIQLHADTAHQSSETHHESSSGFTEGENLEKNPQKQYDNTMNSRMTMRPIFTHVDPLRWHGLTLTLAHLLFRHSAPLEQLPSIVNGLMLALNFEHQSATGHYIGTNVRDAACFGIWAVARRYKTEELIGLDALKIEYKHAVPSHSIFQLLADQLVVAAALDPAGNIRRGASAALQELVGRHPDASQGGISLVQTVDYHAVALRSNAILNVASAAALIDQTYRASLFDGLLGWRGIQFPDRDSKTQSSIALVELINPYGLEMLDQLSQVLSNAFLRNQSKSLEARYGYLLALASTMEARLAVLTNQKYLSSAWTSFRAASGMIQTHSIRISGDVGMSAMAAEAVCKLSKNLLEEVRRASPDMSESVQIVSTKQASNEMLLTSDQSTNRNRPESTTVSAQAQKPDLNDVQPITISHLSANLLEIFLTLLDLVLYRKEDFVLAAAGQMASSLFRIIDRSRRETLAGNWVEELEGKTSHKIRKGTRSVGIINALGAVFDLCCCTSSDLSRKVGSALLKPFLFKEHSKIELRVSSMRSLRIWVSGLSSGSPNINASIVPEDLCRALYDGLCDYTTDQRGDIGSTLRLETLQAFAQASSHNRLAGQSEKMTEKILGQVIGLAAEKLDKVRLHAFQVVMQNWHLFSKLPKPEVHLDMVYVSTTKYFTELLKVGSQEDLGLPFFEGYLTSAGGGSEVVIRSSRIALLMHINNVDGASVSKILIQLTNIIQSRVLDERFIVPALALLAYLLEAGVAGKAELGSEWWQNTYKSIARTHYKSTNLRKLDAAVSVYAGLATVDFVRKAALDKLASMLLHPFPKIRNAAADALFVLEPVDEMKSFNWSAPPKDLKEIIERLRRRLAS